MAEKQSRYYVGYMDLLGYRDFFARHEKETETFLATIEEAVAETVAEISAYAQDEENRVFAPSIRVFSDNILLAVRCRRRNADNYELFVRLALRMASIQRKFFTRYGLVLRGSIARGPFYMNEDLVFGKALITAYEMEQRAIFPRIILEQREVRDLLAYMADIPESASWWSRILMPVIFNSLVAVDGDGSYFLNYLYCPTMDPRHLPQQPQNFFQIHALDIDFSMPEKRFEQFALHRTQLARKLSEHGNYSDLTQTGSWTLREVESRRSVLHKYLWVADYHNKFCELAKLPQYALPYTLHTDPRCHQPVVTLSGDWALEPDPQEGHPEQEEAGAHAQA